MTKKAIYPGTFDPITYGHLDIIERASKLFSYLIIAVTNHNCKAKPYFSLEQRINLIRETTKNISNLEVIYFDGLLVDLLLEQKTNFVVRGLRNCQDFEYEQQMLEMNRNLDKNFEMIFLAPSQHVNFISATLVKQIVELKGDISKFVPEIVNKAFNK